MTEPQKKWLAALRSGEYKQGSGRLRVDDSYCCLGVCADLALKEGVPVPDFFNEEMSGWTVLPGEICDWVGLRSIMGSTNDLSQPGLTSLNDNLKMPFPQIADHLEKHYELYFKTEGASA